MCLVTAPLVVEACSVYCRESWFLPATMSGDTVLDGRLGHAASHCFGRGAGFTAHFHQAATRAQCASCHALLCNACFTVCIMCCRWPQYGNAQWVLSVAGHMWQTWLLASMPWQNMQDSRQQKHSELLLTHGLLPRLQNEAGLQSWQML